MRPLLLVPLAGLALVQGPSRTATFTTGKVEALGACDIRPDAMSCWDMDGAPSAELADRVRTALESNGREVQFKYGRKNRYLVVRRPQTLGVSFQATQGTPNEGVYSNFSINGETTVDFMRVSAAPTEASIMLKASANVIGTQDEEIGLKEGTRATIDGREVEIGAAQKVVAKKGEGPNPRRSYGYGTPAPGTDYWTIVFGLKGEPSSYIQWGFTPLDASGAPIQYVDAAGKPISAVKALGLEPTLQPANAYTSYNGENPLPTKPKAAVAYFQGSGPAPAFRATTNIDPKAIASVRIRASHQETAELGPFPLDPK